MFAEFNRQRAFSQEAEVAVLMFKSSKWKNVRQSSHCFHTRLIIFFNCLILPQPPSNITNIDLIQFKRKNDLDDL